MNKSTYSSSSRINKESKLDIEMEIPDGFCFKHALSAIGNLVDVIIFTFDSEYIRITESFDRKKTENVKGDHLGLFHIEIKGCDLPCYNYSSNLKEYSIRIAASKFTSHLRSPRKTSVYMKITSNSVSLWNGPDDMVCIKHEVADRSQYKSPVFDYSSANTYSEKVFIMEKACSHKGEMKISSMNLTYPTLQGILIKSIIPDSEPEYIKILRNGVNRKTVLYDKPDVKSTITVYPEWTQLLKMCTKWAEDKNSPFFIQILSSEDKETSYIKLKFHIAYFGTIIILLRESS